MRVLVAYGTKRGSTGEVAERVAETLRELGLETDLRAASQVKDLGSYAAVVLGGSIYAGHLHPDIQALLKNHHGELSRLPVAIFGGVIDPAKLRFPFNRMTASDARDWHAITAWAETLPARLGLGEVGPARVGDGGVGQDVDERRLA